MAINKNSKKETKIRDAAENSNNVIICGTERLAKISFRFWLTKNKNPMIKIVPVFIIILMAKYALSFCGSQNTKAANDTVISKKINII